VAGFRPSRNALAQAFDRRGAHQPDDLDNIGGLLIFSPAKQRYYAAGTYVCLDGAQESAEREALSALDLFESGRPEDRSFSDEAGARAELALARVHSEQIVGAHEALAPVSPSNRSGELMGSPPAPVASTRHFGRGATRVPRLPGI
jgi:hypothetical protein